MTRKLNSPEQTRILEEWLARYRFKGNPFAEYQAEREATLPEYFVLTPYYDDIFGSPNSPRTIIVYAGRGCGKTAHRIMVANTCRPHNEHSNILAIPYIRFGALSRLIVSDPTAVDLQAHLKQILRLGISALIDSIVQAPPPDSALTFEWLARCKGLCQLYNPDELRMVNMIARLRRLAGGAFSPEPDWEDFYHHEHSHSSEAELAAQLRHQLVAQQPAARFLLDLMRVTADVIDTRHLTR